MSDFPPITKINSMKNVEWGSEEFGNKLKEIEKSRQIQEERNHLEQCIAIIKGM